MWFYQLPLNIGKKKSSPWFLQVQSVSTLREKASCGVWPGSLTDWLAHSWEGDWDQGTQWMCKSQGESPQEEQGWHPWQRAYRTECVVGKGFSGERSQWNCFWKTELQTSQTLTPCEDRRTLCHDHHCASNPALSESFRIICWMSCIHPCQINGWERSSPGILALVLWGLQTILF